MTIEVVDYDDAWPRRAEAACAELQDRLPGLFTLIEYIGSTSVSGLAARPIIDLMAAAEDLARVTADDETLGLLGYQRHETGMPDVCSTVVMRTQVGLPPARCPR